MAKSVLDNKNPTNGVKWDSENNSIGGRGISIMEHSTRLTIEWNINK